MEVHIHEVSNSLGMNAQEMTCTSKKPTPQVRFRQVRGGGEAYWISNKHNNGDFDYWFVIRLIYVAEYGQFDFDYVIEITVVAPSEVPENTRDEYLSGLGCNDDEYDSAEKNIEKLVVLLAEAGCGALVWSKKGDNRRLLYQAATREAQAIKMLFGFYLDRPVNKIGTTGWDMLRGDLLAGLKEGL